MEISEALDEARERWGEAAAIYRDVSREPEHYEVGYFGRRCDEVVFYAMGGGISLEQALETAYRAEGNALAVRPRLQVDFV